jgi:hypothetical protein
LGQKPCTYNECKFYIILCGVQLPLIKVGKDVLFLYVIGNLEGIGSYAPASIHDLSQRGGAILYRAGFVVLLLDYTVLIMSNISSKIRLSTYNHISTSKLSNNGCLLLLYPNQICTKGAGVNKLFNTEVT